MGEYGPTDSRPDATPESPRLVPVPTPDQLFVDVFGRAPLTLPELLKRLARAAWPKEVVVSAADFLSLLRFAPGAIERDQDDRAFFWVANTRVLCHKPTDTLLDLTQYDGRPSTIVIPKLAGAWAKKE